MRRDQVLRHLESDRPRLFRHDDRLQPRYRAAKAEAGGTPIPMGRMGEVTLDENLEGAMADPFVYDSSNVYEFKSIF